jgi:hypothetical protein
VHDRNMRDRMVIGGQCYKLSYNSSYHVARLRGYSCKRSPPTSTSGRSAADSSVGPPSVEGRTLAACTGLVVDLAGAVLVP